jgi:hypothetical protein
LSEIPVSALKRMGAEVEGALEQVNVPSYVIDSQGIIRWINAAGRRIVGDAVGRQFTSIVAPEETLKAREIFARRILGGAGDASVVVVDTAERTSRSSSARSRCAAATASSASSVKSRTSPKSTSCIPSCI